MLPLPPDPFHSLLPSTFLLSYLLTYLHDAVYNPFAFAGGEGTANTVE